MRSLLALALICANLAGCATTTTIKTIPPGARAYVDDEFLGETPVEFSDSSAFWTRPRPVLRKDGQQDKEVFLRKNRLRTESLIGTILITVPVFWLFGYPEAVTSELEPTSAENGTGAQPGGTPWRAPEREPRMSAPRGNP